METQTQYYQDMTPEEIMSYRLSIFARWVQSILVTLVSLAFLPSLILWVTQSIRWSLYVGLPITAFLFIKFILPRIFKETDPGEMLILENPLAGGEGQIIARKDENQTSTETTEVIPENPPVDDEAQVILETEESAEQPPPEPLEGFLVIRPARLTAAFFWEGEHERVDVRTEVFILSSSLPEADRLVYTKDGKTYIVEFRVPVSALQNVKWLANIVRYPKEGREKVIRELVTSHVSPILREWFAEYDSKDIKVAGLKSRFANIFKGSELDHLEKKTGHWTGEPELISFRLDDRQQKIQENQSVMDDIEKRALRLFDADPRTPLAVHHSNVASNLGLETPDNYRQINITGDTNAIAALAATGLLNDQQDKDKKDKNKTKKKKKGNK